MSVRRLAEDSVQPQAFKFNREFGASAKKWIKQYPKGREQSAVIPLLMLAQEQEGWVTKAAIERISEMLDMPLIRVLEVATFYTQFMLAPVGTKAHIQVCGTTPCMLRGSEELISLCKKKIHPEPLHPNEDGTLSWEEVECQGACVNAPMVMIFKDSYEDLTVEKLEEIIDAFEAGKGGTVKPGPQIDRTYSAPEGGLTSLISDVIAKVPGSRKSGSAKDKPGKKPANAARPKTEAIETARAIKSPKKANERGKNSTLRLADTASRVRPKAKSKTTVSGGNSTMKLAATASGRAAKPKPPKTDDKPSLKDKNRPPQMKKPKKADDLKMISGVGPKIEGILNELGIYTFAQISAWKKAEREWVDGYLKFKGRIDRDDWVKQAKALAKGGRDEYVRVFGKEPR